jgi:acyl-CoA thioesterase-2
MRRSARARTRHAPRANLRDSQIVNAAETSDADAVQRLLDLLDLERLDRDLFRAAVTGPWPTGRLFGGQVAAQALRAAAHTVDVDHHPHSLHGYFLRPGSPATPVLLHVDRIRDGRSFTTRRVVAVQEGEAIFTLGASFHRDEPDGEYQAPPPAGVPPPDADVDWYESPLSRFGTAGPFDVRELAPSKPDARGAIETTRRVWVRVRSALDDDRALHACLLTFVSDMGAVYAAAIPVGGELGTIMGASLDHAVWFHRPIRLDEWVLYDLRPVSNAGSRGLVNGTFHTHEGVLGASVAQEALIRPLAGRED